MSANFHVYPFRSAMHGAMEFRTRRFGWVCFKPPTRSYGKWWPGFFYLSPNATPWAATLLIGRGYTATEKRMAKIRHLLWGHGYDPNRPESDPQSAAAYARPIAGELSSDKDDGVFSCADRAITAALAEVSP